MDSSHFRVFRPSASTYRSPVVTPLRLRRLILASLSAGRTTRRRVTTYAWKTEQAGMTVAYIRQEGAGYKENAINV